MGIIHRTDDSLDKTRLRAFLVEYLLKYTKLRDTARHLFVLSIAIIPGKYFAFNVASKNFPRGCSLAPVYVFIRHFDVAHIPHQPLSSELLRSVLLVFMTANANPFSWSSYLEGQRRMVIFRWDLELIIRIKIRNRNRWGY